MSSSTEQPGAEPDAALVERVARALCLADPSADAPDPDDNGFGVYDGPAWHCWADDARAAIAAMQPELAAAREAGRQEGDAVRKAALALGQAVQEVAQDAALGLISFQQTPPQDEPEVGCSREFQEGYQAACMAFAQEKLPRLVAAHDQLRLALATPSTEGA